LNIKITANVFAPLGRSSAHTDDTTEGAQHDRKERGGGCILLLHSVTGVLKNKQPTHTPERERRRMHVTSAQRDQKERGGGCKRRADVELALVHPRIIANHPRSD
jgi:hypothetical protein